MDSGTRTLTSILRKLDDGLRGLYGGRYRGLVLYGFQARGEADERSAVDLLLLLDGAVEVGAEIRRFSKVVASLSLDTGRVLSLIPVNAEDYRNSSAPYLVNACRGGILFSREAV